MFRAFSKARRRVLSLWSRFTYRFTPKSIGFILRYLPKHVLRLVLSTVCMAAAGALGSLVAVLVGRLTDEGFLNLNPNVIWWAPAALILITALNGGFAFAGSYLLQSISQSIINDLRVRMFARMVHWDAPVFQDKTPGRVHTVFLNQVANALQKAASIMTVFVRDSLAMVSLVAVLFWHDWKLSLVTLVVGPLIGFVIHKVNRRTKMLALGSQETLGDITDVVTENHANCKVVKIYDAYEREAHRFRQLSMKFRRLELKSHLTSAAGTPLTQVTLMAGVGVVLVVALSEAQAGIITVGQFITYITAMLLLSPPLRHLAGLSADIAKVEAAADSLYEFMHAPEEPRLRGRVLDKPLRGDVEVRHVSFAYGEESKEYALRDVSFVARAGEKVALVGASGAGKTTLVSLLPAFLAPSEGEILFDGMRSDSIALQSLRRNLAIVTQDVMLFDTSLAENIAYGKPGATRQEIEDAAKAACLEEFVRSLPKGLDTRIGQQGSRLSGGQRQRVSIARAIIKKAPILLLDEATSALDTESERFIQASLDRLMSSCTTIVVAHRLSTVVNADRILVFDHGEIVESGRHEELLALGGAYARLYALQFSDKAQEAAQ